MIYKFRIERNITVEYNGGNTVSIVSEEPDYDGRTQISSVTVENIGALIQALQDVNRLKYDDW